MSANSSACTGDDDEFVVELGSEVGGMDCLVDFGVECWLDHGCWGLEERNSVTAIAAVASGAVGSINFSERLPPLKSGTALRFLSRNRNIADHHPAPFRPSLSILPHFLDYETGVAFTVSYYSCFGGESIDRSETLLDRGRI